MIKNHLDQKIFSVDDEAFGQGDCRPVWDASRSQWVFNANFNECDIEIESKDLVDPVDNQTKNFITFGKASC